ncbi:UPF0149 family protein [Muribacter muris]|uniref:UPF0149 family protein n=1 Tax=Muribacter muris TaxID=67855 RepID=A0A4Y9JWM8_9PAST|nr:UPF0149 family protein [Muribacter muris]MBF0785132.1 UPF0149 family protein [Muribacter muris]MBF0826854.1 UPF0149 family protein [Muribacter muris]TFV10223.1 UPF0149 family protein [Muribacter muris]
MAISHRNDFKQLISELQIDYTPAEFHGFLSGLLAGGIQDNSWQTLTYQFTHNGHAFSQAPLAKLTDFYQQLSQSFDEADTLFSLWQPADENGFTLADSIAEWTEHFLLGLGLAQPKLQQETDEVGEAIDDLAEIAKLGYDEQDNNDDLLAAGEEIIEYLRVVSLFLHSHFSPSCKSENPQLH